MNISLFPKVTAIVPIETISVVDFLNGVKYGKWKSVINPVRTEVDKEKRKLLKELVPAVSASCTCSKRNQENVIEHSGIICIDVDGQNDMTPFKSDPYTFACFKSISGNGIAIFVKVDPKKHKESFKWLQQYYYNTYGITIDPAPQNIVSLRFVSYDPDLFINERAKVSKTLAEPKAKPHTLPMVLSQDRVGEYVREAVQRNLNIAPTYKEYLELGFALSSGFGELGREYFHALCSTSEKYNSLQADRQYDICLKGAGKAGIGVGTFYYLLKQSGIQIKAENTRALQVAAIGKKAKRTKEGIAKQLEELEGMTPENAAKLVDSVFERDDITINTVSADPERLIQSLVIFLKHNHPMKINEITKAVEENGVEVKKERLNYIYLSARAAFNSPSVTYELIERIIFSDFTPKYHPIRDYIEMNRHRNNDGQIDTFIKSINSPTPHYGMFIRKWLISIIAALEGHPVRLVLALCGGQHNGKTETFRRILPEKLQRYYAESKMDAGKDDDLLMCQKLIIMDDELDGKSKQDEKRFKALTSKKTFSLRAPYGRANEDFNRLAVLCGTSNTMDIISDPTGNSRMLPIEVLSIDYEMFNSIDKDELFLEMVRCYERGDSWQLTKQEMADLSEVSSEFEAISMEREAITKFFGNDPSQGYQEEMTATDIKNHIELNSKLQIKNMKVFGMELKKYFGKRIPRKVSGTTVYVYKVVKFTTNPANQYQQTIDTPLEGDVPF